MSSILTQSSISMILWVDIWFPPHPTLSLRVLILPAQLVQPWFDCSVLSRCHRDTVPFDGANSQLHRAAYECTSTHEACHRALLSASSERTRKRSHRRTISIHVPVRCFSTSCYGVFLSTLWIHDLRPEFQHVNAANGGDHYTRQIPSYLCM
jgi:hypothetical protein